MPKFNNVNMLPNPIVHTNDVSKQMPQDWDWM